MMEEETAFQDLLGFEFFLILLPNFLKKLRLPDKFAKVLDGRELREVKLREAGRQRHLWDMEVVLDAEGHMYLGHGWEQFARAHNLRLGHFLVLSYDGHAVLTVKVFDGSMCRRHYQHDNDASSASTSDSGNTMQGAEGEGEVPPQRGAEEDGEQVISKMSNPCDSDGSQKERSYSSEELSVEDSVYADNSVASANLQTLSNDYVLSAQCYLTKAQKVKIDVLIEKIQPKFTVLVVQMKKSNIQRHTLVIQKDYALEHFPCENKTVILQLPGKNKGWKCTFRIRPSGQRILYLRNFACGNRVREGDICLFQPMTNIKQRRFIVTVHILHKARSDGCSKEGSSQYYKSANTAEVSYTSKEFSEKNPSADESMQLHDLQMSSKDYVLSGKCDLTLAQEEKIQALLGKIQPEIPVMVVQMKKSNVDHHRRTLGIPKDYALKHFPCEDTSITLQLPRKNKNWTCKLHIRPSGVSNAGRRSLYVGNFVHDTHVREGDIFLFQPLTNVKQRRFIIIAHPLHEASTDHSPGGRTNIGSNHGRTCAKMGGVKVKPPTDGEEYSSKHEEHEVSEDSEETLFMLDDGASLTPAQNLKCLVKVEEIKFKPPFYVAIMSKNTVHHQSGSQRSARMPSRPRPRPHRCRSPAPISSPAPLCAMVLVSAPVGPRLVYDSDVEICQPKIPTDPLVERLNLVEKENNYLKEKLKRIKEEKMKLELHVADVVDDHKIQMDAMRLKIRKIRKYAIDNEDWYHYDVGSIVTLVAIIIAFVVAFKCFT